MNMHVPFLSFARDPQPAPLLAAAVREEALLALADLGEALPLVAWRGRSGRRYVVSIFDAGEAPPIDHGAVLLAVARMPCGEAVLLGSIALTNRSQGDDAEGNPSGGVIDVSALETWCTIMRARGAGEWHIHLLATQRLAQEAMRADLTCLPRTTS
ncbi:MAG: hypothetical protein JJU21_04605 [Salinarimonas sp.]|nr:hypothetical protein [Salinarimonas sp.]